MKTFQAYLSNSGKTLGEVAKEAGISYSYMADLARGEKTPSLKTAAAIEAATGGKIPVKYWLKIRAAS